MQETRLLETLRRLEASQSQFILVGGLAAVLNGAPIQTYDIDVVYARTPDNIQRLLTALESLHAIFRIQPQRLDVRCKWQINKGPWTAPRPRDIPPGYWSLLSSVWHSNPEMRKVDKTGVSRDEVINTLNANLDRTIKVTFPDGAIDTLVVISVDDEGFVNEIVDIQSDLMPDRRHP